MYSSRFRTKQEAEDHAYWVQEVKDLLTEAEGAANWEDARNSLTAVLRLILNKME